MIISHYWFILSILYTSLYKYYTKYSSMTGNMQRTDVYTPYVQLPAKELMMLKQPTNEVEKRCNSFLVEPLNNAWLVVANYPEAGSPS